MQKNLWGFQMKLSEASVANSWGTKCTAWRIGVSTFAKWNGTYSFINLFLFLKQMYIDPRTKLKAKKMDKIKEYEKNRRSPHASFLVSWLGSPHSFLISNKFISTKHSLLKTNLITSGFCLMYSIISIWFSGKIKSFSSVQFSRSAILTLCYPMNRSTPGLPVHHQFPEFTQTHVLQVGDAIQPSHPLSSLLLLPPIPPSIKSLKAWKQKTWALPTSPTLLHQDSFLIQPHWSDFRPFDIPCSLSPGHVHMCPLPGRSTPHPHRPILTISHSFLKFL